MISKLTIVPSILLTLCVSGAVIASPPSPQEKGVEFFEKQVRPLLAARCYACHSAAKATKGGLALDTREAMLKGGGRGPALVAGDPERSLIVSAVRQKNNGLKMPPTGRLSDPEIKILEDWVRMGAPDPRTREAAAGPAKLPSPNLKEGRRFWSFMPMANPALPVVKNAARVQSPIDTFILSRLERTGLKLAPPADKRTLIRRATFDLIGLPPTPREVDAFVADTSPDAFNTVVERLLASPQYGERWGRHWLDVARYADSNGLDENIAYGEAWRYRDYVVRAFNQDKPFDQFLIEQIAGDLLPYNEDALTATGYLAIGAHVLAEPDVQKLEMDVIDEQLDTVSKTFMGMTFGCARCHDHKFDPIKQEEYYALAAIFRSTRSLSDKTGGGKSWFERPLATPDQIDAKKKLDALIAKQKADLAAFIASARSRTTAGLQLRAADYLAASALLPANATIADAELAAKGRNLDARFVLACRRYLDQHPDHPIFAEWRKLALKKDADGVRQHFGPIFTEALKTKKGGAYEALTDAKGFLALPVKDADALDAATLAQIDTMTRATAKLESEQPQYPQVMSVAEAATVRTLPVHIRGDYLTLGKPVERGFPEVMCAGITKTALPAEQSGRLELARWMAGSEHPLTARVMVNRVWRWHFGQGIVGSTDNFGILGSKPSHPEMLDWLARTFIEGGWSIKKLHRLIMKSAAYQQSSNPKPGNKNPRSIDPENRLLWRANIQRLEAEQIRDAMLAAGGWLNLKMGGKTIPLKDKEYVFDHTSKDATTYESPRRALYLPIIRNHLYDMLEQFDYPDPTMPTGSRNSTVIAPQALIMMNAPVVMESSARLAARLAPLPDDNRRVQEAYALLYGRLPLAREKSDALALLRDFRTTGKPESAWARLCQTLFAANEFIYLR
jgi:hypothetical protein